MHFFHLQSHGCLRSRPKTEAKAAALSILKTLGILHFLRGVPNTALKPGPRRAKTQKSSHGKSYFFCLWPLFAFDEMRGLARVACYRTTSLLDLLLLSNDMFGGHTLVGLEKHAMLRSTIQAVVGAASDLQGRG